MLSPAASSNGRPSWCRKKRISFSDGGNLEDVEARFAKYACAYSKARMTDDLNDLTLIELSEYKVTREMACYVICRAAEFTATGFVRDLADRLTDGGDPVAWLESEMERIPIGLDEKERR